jgi:maltose O-acetyltransferase
VLRLRIADHAFSAYLRVMNAGLRFPGHGFRLWLLRRCARFEIGPECAIQRSVQITGRGGVRIGSNCNINAGVLLDGRGGLKLGAKVNVSEDVLFLTADHDPQSPTFSGRDRAVEVGDRAWIATRAIVLPGTKIGDGVIVGAGAVVHGSVAPWTIVAGNPATVIGARSPTAQEELTRYARFLH